MEGWNTWDNWRPNLQRKLFLLLSFPLKRMPFLLYITPFTLPFLFSFLTSSLDYGEVWSSSSSLLLFNWSIRATTYNEYNYLTSSCRDDHHHNLPLHTSSLLFNRSECSSSGSLVHISGEIGSTSCQNTIITTGLSISHNLNQKLNNE